MASFLTVVAYPWCTIMSLFSIVIVFRWGQCREKKKETTGGIIKKARNVI